MADKFKRIPIDIAPGTHPDATDSTTFGAVRCIDTDKIYFKRVDGQTYIRSLDPWVDFGDGAFSGNVQQAASVQAEETDMVGTPHTMSWHYVANVAYLIVGTSRKLYAVDRTGVNIYDITPLRVTSDAIANSLATTNGSPFITVTHASHGLSTGDYVRLSGAADTGGILAANINRAFAVDVVNANSYIVRASTNASSTVSGGGGGSVVAFRQVLSSGIDRWSVDSFGAVLVINPGFDGEIYEWDGTTSTLPTQVSNAPTANWIFVSNNSLIALAADGVPNRIMASSIGDRTAWTAGAPGSTAWQDDVEGITKFMCSAYSRGQSLLFTPSEILLFKYSGLPNLWDYEFLMRSEGITGKKAVCDIEDVVYWIGSTGNAYWFDGSTAQIIPGNTCEFLMRANADASSFVRPVPEYRQVWFYTGGYYVIFDYEERHFTSGTHNCAAAENPAKRLSSNVKLTFASAATRVGDSAALTYLHELSDSASGDFGSEASGNRKSYFVTAYRTLDDNRRADIREFSMGYEGDSSVFSVTLTTKDDIHGTGGGGGMTAGAYTYNPDNSALLVDGVGKQWSWRVEKSQSPSFDTFAIGKMTEGIQPGVPL